MKAQAGREGGGDTSGYFHCWAALSASLIGRGGGSGLRVRLGVGALVWRKWGENRVVEKG